MAPCFEDVHHNTLIIVNSLNGTVWRLVVKGIVIFVFLKMIMIFILNLDHALDKRSEYCCKNYDFVPLPFSGHRDPW